MPVTEEYPSDPALTLNVKISACQFQQPNLVKEIRKTLQETGLAPHDLKLEITESVMMHDASAISALKELKGRGSTWLWMISGRDIRPSPTSSAPP